MRWDRSSCTRSVKFSPAIGSIHSGSFFTELFVQAQEVGNLEEVREKRSWKKSSGSFFILVS